MTELVVTRMELVAKGVLHLTLADDDGAELPTWAPGAHVDLQFTTARGDQLVRQYSLCGRPSDRHHLQVAVLLVPDGRGGSAHIHESLAVGTTVHVSAPRNNFPLGRAPRYLFIAGGIGITPIVPMIAQAEAAEADWRLVYCGRSTDSMAFLDEMIAYGPNRVAVHADDMGGRADLGAVIEAVDRDTQIYCCGPESMLDAVEARCAELSHGGIHTERFGRRDRELGCAKTVFEVEFARSGVVLQVPDDRSILELAEEAGVDIDSSCQEGVCGSCETAVLSGIPDHRDEVLTADERSACKTMMVCVSRACSSRLVLDA